MTWRWVLPCTAAAGAAVLTPTAIGTLSRSSAIAWIAILIGSSCLLILLALMEYLAAPPDRSSAETECPPGRLRPADLRRRSLDGLQGRRCETPAMNQGEAEAAGRAWVSPWPAGLPPATGPGTSAAERLSRDTERVFASGYSRPLNPPPR